MVRVKPEWNRKGRVMKIQNNEKALKRQKLYSIFVNMKYLIR